MIAVLGGRGQLGTAFGHRLGGEALLVDRSQLDLSQIEEIGPWVRRTRPEALINCAAYTAVDDAEGDSVTASKVNTLAVEALARATAEHGVRFVTFSTDFVFDGTKEGPYVESDPTGNLSVYGRTKAEGERLALAANPEALVVRTSWVFSATHRNFVSTMFDLVSAGPVSVVDDQRGRPTVADDLAESVMAALEAGASGLLHLTNAGEVNRFDLARMVAELGGLDVGRVIPIASDDLPNRARRPLNSVLDSERLQGLGLQPLPHFRAGLVRVMGQILTRSRVSR